MIEKEIQDAISSLASGGAHFDAVPDGTLPPYITIQQVGGSEPEFLSGVSDKNQPRIQITVFSLRRTEANAIQSNIRAVICVPPLDGSPAGAPVSLYADQVKIFQRSCDYTFLSAA